MYTTLIFDNTSTIRLISCLSMSTHQIPAIPSQSFALAMSKIEKTIYTVVKKAYLLHIKKMKNNDTKIN